MKWNEKAALIGYWRCGCKCEEIACIMEITVFDAERIIFNYTKGLK